MGHYLSIAREVIAGAVGRPIGEVLGADTEPNPFEAAVIRWLNNNPPTDLDPDVCGCCGEPLGRIGPDAVPFLTGAGRHVWLHHGCHGDWMAQRRAEAVQALAGLGLKPPDRKEA